MKFAIIFGSAWRSNDPCAVLGPFDSRELAQAAIDAVGTEVPGGLREDGIYGIFPITDSMQDLKEDSRYKVIWNDPEEDW